jgi:hypothetical protein
MQLIYSALTFEMKAHWGHVGMYIAAVLYPLLALLSPVSRSWPSATHLKHRRLPNREVVADGAMQQLG